MMRYRMWVLYGLFVVVGLAMYIALDAKDNLPRTAVAAAVACAVTVLVGRTVLARR
jgi:hypothetical protein